MSAQKEKRKKKDPVLWTSEAEEKLIACVFKHPPIWRKRDKNHANGHLLKIKWDAVHKEMDTDIESKYKQKRDLRLAEVLSISL